MNEMMPVSSVPQMLQFVKGVINIIIILLSFYTFVESEAAGRKELY